MFFFRKKKRPSVKSIAQEKTAYPLPTTRLISKRNSRTAVDKTTISASDISVPPSCSSTDTDNTHSSQSVVSSLENISNESSQKVDDTAIGNNRLDHEQRSIATITESIATVSAHALSLEVQGDQCISDNASIMYLDHKDTVQQRNDELNLSTSVETTAVEDDHLTDNYAPRQDVIIDKCPTAHEIIVNEEEKPIASIKHNPYNNNNSTSNRASGIPRLRSSANTISSSRTSVVNNKTATSHIPVRKMRASSINNNTITPSGANSRITIGQCHPGRLVCGTRLPVRRA
ncbi:hypothetical protein K492DRAFT_205821 [Lichtheimia hyalospora FSU 10163]|nr:hypothetical protein K492DRAFT_205821 [Lichtheimia hyalospora FSU 10163]